MSAQHTPLYECHTSLGAQLVEFAGALLPLRFSSEKEEHLAVRHHVAMFDVSHMGEFFIDGPDAARFLMTMLTNNCERLEHGQAQYSLMLNHEGGIIDDIIVYKKSTTSFMLCVNAANIAADWQWLKQHQEGFNIILDNASPRFAQIALQGPEAAGILARFVPELPKRFYFIETDLLQAPSIIARTGYTGEDGFEIFVANDHAAPLWQALLQAQVKPAGLAARDSLRLEAGLLLHGTDMDTTISPLEARLNFAIDFSKNFIGKEALLKQKEMGLTKRLIGFRLIEKGIARHGFHVYDNQHAPIGIVSSGTWPPEQETAVGLAYCHKMLTPGDSIFIDIRNRFTKAVVTAPKFLKNKR